MHNTLEIGVCVFFYLTEQHSKFLWHTLQVLYMCTLCDLQTSTRKSISFQTVCSMSAVMVSVLVNCAPSGEMHNYCTPHIIKENFENFLIHRYNYILLSQVYCVWQVVKIPTIILNNPVFLLRWTSVYFSPNTPATKHSWLTSHENVFRRWRNTTDNTVRLLWFCVSWANDCWHWR